MMSFKISAIPQNLVDWAWPIAAPQLQRVCDLVPKELDMDSLKERIKCGETTLAFVTNEEKLVACLTFEMRTFPTGHKVLYLPIVAGNGLDDCFDIVMEQIKDAAKTLGCHEIRGFAARDGWLRRLKNEGWQQVHTLIALEV